MRANELVRKISNSLACVSDCPDFESKCLVSHFLNIELNDIYLGNEIGNPDLSEIDRAVKKRKENYPLQYIIGKWEFMGYEFLLNENVLIPRPETELLCECLLDKIDKENVVYDICAGTGCIGISIALLTNANVFCFEKYDGAFEILNKNIALNNADNVSAIKWDIFNKPDFEIPKADFIFSNPPYIESGLVPTLQKEVLKEPLTALDGGEDGLFFYRAIYENFSSLLKPGGYLALEIGEGQQKEIIDIFSSFSHIRTIKDYNSTERVVVFRKDI